MYTFWIFWHCVLMSSSWRFSNALNLFCSSVTNLVLTVASLSLAESKSWPLVFLSTFFNLSWSLHNIRLWSLPTSAPLMALTSVSDHLHFLLMVMWSIWLFVLLSGDIHVLLCIVLCWKKLPPIIWPFSMQRSMKRCPLSFLSPKPSIPMHVS